MTVLCDHIRQRRVA